MKCFNMATGIFSVIRGLAGLDNTLHLEFEIFDGVVPLCFFFAVDP